MAGVTNIVQAIAGVLIFIGAGLVIYQVLLGSERRRRPLRDNSIVPIETGGLGIKMGALSPGISSIALGTFLLLFAIYKG